MKRRTLLQLGIGATLASPLVAALRQDKLDAAVEVLSKATETKQVAAASLYVRQGKDELVKSFGAAKSPEAMFLIASISKTMSVAAVMTLYDRGEFRLEDPVQKYIPEFKGEGREKITIEQLLTHVSGLPDQLPINNELRRNHAPLSAFVKGAIRTPLLFAPGTKYEYSSMAILLAAEIAQRISQQDFLPFVDQTVIQPLNLKHSAIGLGNFKLADLMRVQTEHAAPESGGGDPTAKEWDWNSEYWRTLGAPWGTVHASATDVGRFFWEFLHPEGKMLKAETTALMIRNHNPAGITPRGLGFELATRACGERCSEKTFGHHGSTGTMAWADPVKDTVCVVLTTLPGRAASPHPYQVVSDLVAEAAG